MAQQFFEFVKTAVDNEAILLNNISQELWKNPELKHEEVFAHNLLSNTFQEKGFTVEKQFILPTAFRATFDSGKPGNTVALICEYDALPKIGHACGHNLIAETGLGAGLAIKEAMQKFSDIAGKVVVFGTPAEEGGAGKIKMIEGGAFKNVDVALMVHPGASDDMYPPFIAIQGIVIRYEGKETHASGYPWEGLNALDAAVACYNNIALLRQQIKPTQRVHAIISKGGDAPNVIPGNTELKLYYRAASTQDMNTLWKRVQACIKSAATATGCQVEVEICDNKYKNLITNKHLAEVYQKYSEALGTNFTKSLNVLPFMASSDMGDVSHLVPSIHPIYGIGTKASNHSIEFTKASGAPEAQNPTLIAAKSLAILGIHILYNNDLLVQAKEQFLQDIAADMNDSNFHGQMSK